MEWIIVVVLAVLLWQVVRLRAELRRALLAMAAGVGRFDERLADAEHGIDQARTAANDAREAITADLPRDG